MLHVSHHDEENDPDDEDDNAKNNSYNVEDLRSARGLRCSLHVSKARSILNPK